MERGFACMVNKGKEGRNIDTRRKSEHDFEAQEFVK